MRRFDAIVLSLLMFGFENVLTTWTLVDMLWTRSPRNLLVFALALSA